MSTEAAKVKRQWVSMPGASCDVRIGKGALSTLGSVLKNSAASNRTCAYFVGESAPADVAEELERELMDAQFKVVRTTTRDDAQARTLTEVEKAAAFLAQEGIGVDDLICVLGHTDALSAASFLASSWCGGTQLVQVPLDLAACTEAAITPRGLDVSALAEGMATRVGAKYQICDTDLIGSLAEGPEVELARALMASTALCDCEAAFGRLWDRAELLAEGDEPTIADQLADTAKSRGKVSTSTSISIKQSLGYGVTFMKAMRPVVGDAVSEGVLVAEGMRFLARLACGMEHLSVDDVLTIDELLDMLGLGYAECLVDPQAMVDALKGYAFARSNRFMLELPRAIGRVRPGTVEDELLLEHATAWCASRMPEE